MQIRPFDAGDEEQVIALWERCGLVEPHNNPQLDIERKQRDDAKAKSDAHMLDFLGRVL